ncbi:MAG: PQQ-dependent sugar dehydrogenase [Chitinophagaceae bacterium]|nr:PQQ-dependent sugar dehydrogenase [Chitinophagaceae bacterium]
MKQPLLCLLFIVIVQQATGQTANNLCASAVNLTPSGTFITATGDLYLANATGSPTSTCNATRNDVWYRFTTPVGGITFATISVTLTSNPSSLTSTNTFIELYNATTCANATAVNTLGCFNVSAKRSWGGLAANTIYYFRVFTTAGTGSNPSRWGFTVTGESNNECSSATSVVPGTTNLMGSLFGATASSGIPTGCLGDPDDDVWYRFIAPASYATITLGSVGANLATSGARMQVFSQTTGCGSLVSFACNTQTNVLNLTGLDINSTYYIRVYGHGTGNLGASTANAGSVFTLSITPSAPTNVTAGRMKEVYRQIILSAPGVLADPWEVTYGPDGYLWITESKGSRIYRMHPTTGVRDTLLNISQGSTFFTLPAETAFNLTFDVAASGPQGGLAGLALHPNLLHPTDPKNFVYVSYIHTSNGGSSPTGIFFTNRIARFNYNPTTKKLESPISICDTIRGSNDHNSQRMAIAKVGDSSFLFYAAGDMGSGQFSNRDRPMRAQDSTSYEGKILRFRLVPDADVNTYQRWIPNDNPYTNSAVWCIGIRNNQGFAVDTLNKILYGSSHGPYSDDEINIIQRYKNYGHPLVIGYKADDNYNTSTAGASNTTSSCPMINDESFNADSINTRPYAKYKDPLFSAYAEPQASLHNIWLTNPGNGGWPSEGWSGMDFYSNNIIPNWKNSLIVSSLKWGRILKLKLGAGDTTIVKTAGFDTVSYFGSTNRFRDIAFSPNGRDMYVVMDRSATTSGPSAASPVVPACGGCVQKYSFLGYSDVAGKSSISDSIYVTAGSPGSCLPGTTIIIDSMNTNLWVPITGPEGNIMAEIKANGNILDTIRSSFYVHGGPTRVTGSKRYLNRNITINPKNTPVTPVSIRLYISKAEFDTLDANPLSGISSIGDLKILKNSDTCGNVAYSNATAVTTGVALAHGEFGYVLGGDVSSFSTFYFGSAPITLPVNLLTFTGELQGNATLLEWKTTQETNTSHFVVERSLDGNNYSAIGNVAAAGSSNSTIQYNLIDHEAGQQPTTILYYRLKMMDRDGQFTYSNVITIVLPTMTGKIAVTPNPVASRARVLITATRDGKTQWKLTDNSGRVISNGSENIRKGNNQFYIDMNKLSAGVYYLNVNGAGIDNLVKIQKQ